MKTVSRWKPIGRCDGTYGRNEYLFFWSNRLCDAFVSVGDVLSEIYLLKK